MLTKLDLLLEIDLPDVVREKDAHTEHCCKSCGCKYGGEGCTVLEGVLPQSYACGSGPYTCPWDDE